MKVVFSRRAERDLLAQIAWLADLAPAAARRASDEIEAAVQLIRDFPLAAPLVDDRHHAFAVSFGRDGFVIRYVVRSDQVTVVRLYHGRQLRRRPASNR